MNKLCVVARNFQTYFIQRLIEEVGKKNLVLANPWENPHLPQEKIYLIRSTGVYRDDLDLRVLDGKPARMINPLSCHRVFRDKRLQYRHWEERGIEVLPWMDLKGKAAFELKDFFEQHELQHAIVKPHRGQGGWGVQRLDLMTLKEWWSQKLLLNDEDYLIQAPAQGREMRLFYLGNGKQWVLERKGEKVAANFHQSGTAHQIEMPYDAKDLLQKVIQDSGSDYGAIDFFYHQGRVHLLELNLCPGLEQLEQVTRENVMNQLIKSLNLTT